jgi:hypothetical protein
MIELSSEIQRGELVNRLKYPQQTNAETDVKLQNKLLDCVMSVRIFVTLFQPVAHLASDERRQHCVGDPTITRDPGPDH